MQRLELLADFAQRALDGRELAAERAELGEAREHRVGGLGARAAGERAGRVVEIAVERHGLEAELVADGACRLLVGAHEGAAEDVLHRRRDDGVKVEEVDGEVRLGGADELLGGRHPVGGDGARLDLGQRNERHAPLKLPLGEQQHARLLVADIKKIHTSQTKAQAEMDKAVAKAQEESDKLSLIHI